MAKNATVKLVLRAAKRKADGTAPVYLRVTADRKSRYLATGVAVEPKHWNENKRAVRASHPLAPALNAKLQDLLMKATRQALETPSAAAVKENLTGAGGTLTAYFDRFINELDAAGRFWEWKKYRVTLGKLRDCFGKELDWKQLDRPALARFERHLRERCGNGPNTVRKELQRLRRVVRQAIKDGIVPPSADPFLLYDRPPARKPDRAKLTLEEVQALEALDLEVGSVLAVSRDAFVLAFYGGGDALRRRVLPAPGERARRTSGLPDAEDGDTREPAFAASGVGDCRALPEPEGAVPAPAVRGGRRAGPRAPPPPDQRAERGGEPVAEDASEAGQH